MCSEPFLKRFGVFVLTFGLGVLAFGNCIFNQIEANSKQSSQNTQSTFFNPPKAQNCIDLMSELNQKKADLIIWLEKNKNTNKKQSLAKVKELEELKVQIGVLEELKNFRKYNPQTDNALINPIYREKCYEF